MSYTLLFPIILWALEGKDYVLNESQLISSSDMLSLSIRSEN